MAVIVSSSSSNSDVPGFSRYDVFISFRGEDTRMNFTSHLYAAFCRKKIKAYIDEHSLEKGDQISPALLKAIQESKLSVIIFSKDYASSTWCLEELVHILKCHRERGQIILPVFYGIDPSYIRKQKETYATAFAAHEERFKDRMEKVKEWRDALTAAANISGFDSRNGSESKLVEMIVECTLRMLNRISSTVGTDDFKNLVGIDKRVQEVENLLSIDSSNVRIIGIWGMGGIGKTTLANVIFNRLIYQYESGCFLSNVKEESMKQGLISLQKKLLVELLEEDEQILDTSTLRSTFVKERLLRKKVLVVIDDVDSSEQVEWLIGDHIQFGVGSTILVTTRDSQVLRKKTDLICTLEGLEFDEALELFYLNAFKRNSSRTSYIELSERVVSYTKGNPLALKVLGSFLHSRTKEEWENALNKLEMIPHPDILKVLRISFDDGLDDLEKNIFLDIACFFKGENRSFVERILEGCEFFPTIGIKVLIDKSLITLNDRNEIWMHDLLQEVGWEIVREESIKDPGKRSRLWVPEDVCLVLKNKRATETLEGMYLDMSKIDEEIHLKRAAFKKMCNLRLLKIYNSNNDECKVYATQGFQFFPDSIRYLSWYKYPSKSLPPKFEPRNLVELDMPHSELKELWNGVQNFRSLKHINLGFSDQLIKVPDLSRAPKLESINVEFCPSLIEVPQLNFKIFYQHECHVYCHYSDGRHLGSLTLHGCTNFKSLPEIHGNIKYLDLRRTALEELPSSIGLYENLIILKLTDCLSLKNLPNLPRNIEILDLCDLAIEQMPSSIGSLHHLREIYLDRCKRLKTLPANIFNLKSLLKLHLNDCSRLQNFSETLSLERSRTDNVFPTSPTEKIFGLRWLYLGGCTNLEFVPYDWFYNLGCLESLSLDGCLKVEHFQTKLLCLYSLTQLHLRCCNILKIPDWIGLLSSLTELHLGGNPFDSIPSTVKQLHQLATLEIRNCVNLRSLPELPLSITNLNASGCSTLKTFSNLGDTHAVCRQTQADVHKFLFCNCLKLNQDALNNFNEFLYAVASMQGHPAVIVYCPGNKISNWFNYQSEGSSVAIKLPSNNWINNNFLGFATCFVVASEATYSPYQCLAIECDLDLKTIDGQSIEKVDSFLGWNFATEDFVDEEVEEGSKITSSDHVFINFSKCEDDTSEKLFNSYFDGIEVSFHFQAFIDDWPSGHLDFEVKRCGVRMLYSQEPKEFSVINNEYGLDADYSRPRRRSTTSHAIIDFDTDQPHPKRSRRF